MYAKELLFLSFFYSFTGAATRYP